MASTRESKNICWNAGSYLSLLIGLLVIALACRTDSEQQTRIRRISPSVLDSTGASDIDAFREEITRAKTRQDSFWRISGRKRPKPQLDVRWSSKRPSIHGRGVAQETFYWMEFKPYVVNTGSDTVRIDHFEPLGMPFCRVRYRGRELRLYDLGAMWDMRTTLTLPPSRPFRYKGSTCSVPIRGEGMYIIVAEAMVFIPFSSREDSLLNQAHKTLPVLEAIRMERKMRQTQPLYVRSNPIVIEVR